MNRLLSAAAIASLTLLPLTAQRGGAPSDGSQVRLIYAEFDPLLGTPPVEALLRAGADDNLWIVQLTDLPTEAMRESLRALGAEVHCFLPDRAHVVRMDRATAALAAKQPFVRWVGAYEPAYRLEPFLRAELASEGGPPPRRYHLVVVDKHRDKPALIAAIGALGGTVDHEQPGSLLLDVTLNGAQLVQVAHLDQVLWIDRWSAPEDDMNNARIQGGANYIEAEGGFAGQGLRGHIYEGITSPSPDFTTAPVNVQSCGSTTSHGQSTAGIVFGNGATNPLARGMAPNAVMFYTNYSCVNAGVSRWQVVQELVNVREVMFTTASWGDATTTAYTSVSADADDIVFDHGIVWSNSQSNTGNRNSRPQAWAKNVFSVGGVAHRDNSDRSDDSWDAGNASIGPAADGRLKPEICAYYDAILTVNTSSFGGTSGATPIVTGHNALAIQMFAAGVFGNAPRVPGGTTFQNRPKCTTLKALQVASARQYPFTSASTDNRREHQGFGFPDLKQMYDNRARMLIVDETDVLAQGGSTIWPVQVLGTEPELKVAMSYADPAGNPAATLTRINDLNLEVTSPTGVVYHGNNGLSSGNYSTPSGAANGIDTVECVFVAAPMAGTWIVKVSAPLIAQDGRVETPAMDADYGLVVTFGARVGSITAFGAGCVGTGLTPNYCASVNANGGTLANNASTNEYTYDLSTGSPITIDAVEFFTASRTGSVVTTTASIYGPGPTTTALRTATISVGTTPQFWRATFSPPVALGAGPFYAALTNVGSTTLLANLTGGTAGGGYYRGQGSTGAWSRSGVIRFASVRAFCQGVGGTPAVPQLTVTGTAEIGRTLSYRVEQAARNRPAVLATGGSNTLFLGIPLPLSLGVIGAPGCSLLVSNDGTLPLTTDANGTASLTIPIPPNTGVIGTRVHQQVLVLDPLANPAGVVTTRAYTIVVGS